MMTNLLFSQLTAIGKRFAMVLTMLVVVGVGNVWGEEIYSNTGASGTTNNITASGNVNNNNGNPKPSFGLTSASKKEITISNLDLSNYEDITLTLDFQLAKSGNSYSSLTVTQYNSNNTSVGSQNITGSNNTSYKTTTVTLEPTCTKVTIVCSPAGSTYATYVDNIKITGTLAASGSEGECGWIETDISNISSTDDVVITMTNGTTTWALTNGNGTSDAPEATPLTMNTDGSISENPNQISDAILWNISTSNNTLTISPKEDPSIWLYVNNSTGNNVRVGNAVNANSNGTFIIEGNYLKNVTKSYYIGVYNNSNWRCYTSTTGNSNIAGQTLKFYKYVACGTTEPTKLATPTNLQSENITSTSADLSWEWPEETNADKLSTYYLYIKKEGDANFTGPITYSGNSCSRTGLESETKYIWKVQAISKNNEEVENSEESETAEFTTLEACTDAVNVIKGTPSNGSFTMVSGYQSTCNGSVTVTLSDIEPATGYQFSAITQTGINSGVTINNTAKTVTYAQNTSGTSTINVTFIEIPKHTVTLNPNYPNGKTGTFKDKGGNTISGNLVLTYDYNTASMSLTDLYQSIELEGYQFNGWYSATSGGSKWTSTGIITKDVTVYAQWSKLYSITLSENGTTTELDAQTSTSYTLPTELSAGSCQDDTKELVGWSIVAIPTPGDKPASNFYELGETVTLTADQTTFHAVFATAEGGGETAELVKMTADDDFNIGDKIVIIAEGTQYGLYQNTTTSNYIDYWTTEDKDGVPTLAEIEEDPKKYFEVSEGGATNTIKLGDATNGYLYNSSSTNLSISTQNHSDWEIIAWTDHTFTFKAGQYLSCRNDLNSDNKYKWRGAGSSCDCETGENCTGIIYYNIYRYTSNNATSYSNYTTSCSTTDCAPTDIQYSSDLNSITVSWNAQSATSTVYLYTDEAGTQEHTHADAGKSHTFTNLNSNTTYYIKIVPGGDSNCASPIIPVKTQIVEMDVIEWKTDGIIVDINTSENIKVVLENEVQYGTGTANKAEDLFFSKYFEGSGTMKLVAIYNGTGQSVSLDNYMIYKQAANQDGNWSSTNDDEYALTSLGSIAHGQEIIFYTRPTDSHLTDCSNDFFNNVKSGKNDNPRWVECNGDPFDKMDFNGNDAIILYKGNEPIDIIGATGTPGTAHNCRDVGSEQGWEGEVTNMDYGKSVDDPSFDAFYKNSSIDFTNYTDEDKKTFLLNCGINIENETIDMTTARCILFRDNSVTSGVNTNTGATFNSFTSNEWNGRSVCQTSAMYNAAGFDDDGQATCNSYQDLGSFNYSDYYTKYDPMPNDAYDQATPNGDGTWTVPISNLNKQSCRKLQVIITNKDDNLLKKEQYKVPIMIDESQTTAGPAFIALQTNLATIITDGAGNVTGTQNLELDEVREICKECDVVILDNATLTKAQDNTANDHPQVHDVVVYEGGSLVIPDGESYNYTINNLSLRRKGDKVASVQIEGDGELVLPESTPVTLSMRIDATNWHWFTLPYNCNIADVTWSDGTPAKYGTDWFLMWYDGESRAASTNPRDNHWKKYNGSTIEAGKGYIIGITGNLAHSNYTFELRFPMVKTVLTNEQENKTVAVNAWGVQSDNTPNNLGWNLVGNPYLNYYQPATSGFTGLPLIKYTKDPETGEWSDTPSGDIPYLVTPVNGGWSEYQQELASNVNMLPFTAYFVQVGDPETHTDGQELQANFDPSKRGRASLIRRAPSEVDEQEEPAIVAVELTNSKGESDKTTLLIADRFTDEYEMNADFFKWFGDYYTYYTKPVLYTLGADNESRAFNALNEELAAQPVELGMYAAQAGNYTFSLNQRSNLTGVAEVWLHDANSNTHTNLMQDDYSFSTAKTNGAGRFSLSVKMASKVTTAVDNITAQGIWATTQDNQIIINGLTKDLQLWIYDATGKLLHADHTTNYQHSYSVPTSGVYFVRVNGKTEAQTIKVVVE